jgi:predicted protein tyrosine phosphatase
MDTNSISHIYKNIYISDYDKASNINTILRHKIGAVLYLGSKEKPIGILKNYKNYKINYRFIQITDTKDSDLSGCFKQVWDFINTQSAEKKNIIVHCRHGISRSPSVVAYYLMRLMHAYMKSRNENYPVLDDVLILIHMNRPCIRPNSGFIKQLKSYENKKINIEPRVKFAPGSKLC